MGLEPTNGGTTNHCLNHLATLAIHFLTIARSFKKDPVFLQETTSLILESWSITVTEDYIWQT